MFMEKALIKRSCIKKKRAEATLYFLFEQNNQMLLLMEPCCYSYRLPIWYY